MSATAFRDLEAVVWHYEVAKANCDREGMRVLGQELIGLLRTLIGPERPVRIGERAYWYSAGKLPELHRGPASAIDALFEIHPAAPVVVETGANALVPGRLYSRDEIARLCGITRQAVKMRITSRKIRPDGTGPYGTTLYGVEVVAALFRSNLEGVTRP